MPTPSRWMPPPCYRCSLTRAVAFASSQSFRKRCRRNTAIAATPQHSSPSLPMSSFPHHVVKRRSRPNRSAQLEFLCFNAEFSRWRLFLFLDRALVHYRRIPTSTIPMSTCSDVDVFRCRRVPMSTYPLPMYPDDDDPDVDEFRCRRVPMSTFLSLFFSSPSLFCWKREEKDIFKYFEKNNDS